MNPEDVRHVFDLLREAHVAFHGMGPPAADDDTCLVALNQRDLLLIGMALPCLEIIFLEVDIACFNEASEEFQSRLLEIVRVQRPEWTVGGEAE